MALWPVGAPMDDGLGLFILLTIIHLRPAR
jgi:hypothetical protein